MGQITVRDFRNGHEFVDCDRTYEQVLQCLVLGDLNCGARVVSIAPTRIETICTFMGANDRLVLEGAEEDMAFLVRIAECHQELIAMQTTRDAIVDASTREFQSLTRGNPLNPMLETALADMLGGGRFTRFALIAALNPSTEAEARSLASITMRDLVAAVVLHVRDSVSVQEIASLAA